MLNVVLTNKQIFENKVLAIQAAGFLFLTVGATIIIQAPTQWLLGSGYTLAGVFALIGTMKLSEGTPKEFDKMIKELLEKIEGKKQNRKAKV